MQHEFSSSFCHRKYEVIAVYPGGNKCVLAQRRAHVLLFRHVILCVTHHPQEGYDVLKCITLCQTPYDFNFYICVAKPLNDGDLYFKSSVSFSSLQLVCCVRSVDHELVSQAKERMFYSLLIT